MTARPFFLVDAFTRVALGGNGCAVVLDADGLDAARMQALAREFNQAETAFVARGAGGVDFSVRYFTPAEEIPLAGHPTIAAVAALLHAGRIRAGADGVALTLALRDGPIRVAVEPARAGEPALVRMTQRRPVFGALHDPAVVAPLFGLRADDVLPGAPVQTVSTGTPQLMMLLRDHDALRRARPPEDAPYSRYKAGSDFFSPHLFCLGGATPEGDTFARHFGVPPDLPEDPVTGSATGGMAAYLWRYGHLARPRFVAEQGHWMGRPGRMDVTVAGPRDAIEHVQVAGTAVVLVEGVLRD
ncbi:MAG: PhzF family phenazine biosynthesis protein [Burkholderiaceae bacterium]